MNCSICPRKCGVDRSLNKGFCGMEDNSVLAKAFLHMWEEPCISGSRGSGTVFFSGCNLKCVFCQNYQISQNNFGKEVSVEQLSKIFLNLQAKGAHNINLVNPTHFVRQIHDAVKESEGLNIPILYNSNGYEGIEGLKIMNGIVDVYLPDLKYFSSEVSREYSSAKDYFSIASKAILEMYRQVGSPVFSSEGIIEKGMIIRHLILPGHVNETISILDWIKSNLPEDIYVSIMSQYTPYYKAELYPEINRRITRREYEKVLNHVYKLGIENGYVQERDSAEEEYIPNFDLEGIL